MDFRTLFLQLSTQFSKLSRNQKLIIAGAITGIVAFIIFLVVYTAKSPDGEDGYKVLFEKLSPSDAALIVEQLEKDKIPYRIPKDNVIEVPSDIVYKERIAIASLGIPNNKGVGFELFDTQEFGSTSFDQNVKYKRALQGELSRTIEALAPVERASVSLAMPKDSLFISKQVDPTASVMIQLKPNATLNSKQIRGIKNLVSAAIPKLTSENVTLVSSDGETLGDDDEFSKMSDLSQMQIAYKTKEEKKKESKIIQVLAPFIGGKDHVVARVSLDYDFSQKNSTKESFDPENVVRSEQSLEEKKEGMIPEPVGGVPGAVSNIGPVEGLNKQPGGEKYEKITNTTNYEISKTVSTIKGQFAKIIRQSAAVIVDGKYIPKVDKNGVETGELEYQPLDKTQLDAISSLVKQAIGFDEQRGDKVTVENLQFESSRYVTGPKTVGDRIGYMMENYVAPFSAVINYIIVIIILFIAYKKIIAPFAERMLEVTSEEEEYNKPQLDIEEDEEDTLSERVTEMRKKVEEQLGLGGNMNEDELKHDVLLEKLRTMVDERSEEVAALLQSLLAEENAAAEGLRHDKDKL